MPKISKIASYNTKITKEVAKNSTLYRLKKGNKNQIITIIQAVIISLALPLLATVYITVKKTLKINKLPNNNYNNNNSNNSKLSTPTKIWALTP